MQRPQYSPPWADTSIIGIAGSSGSGKTSLALTIVEKLNLPWVVILSMDSFYKPLTKEQSVKAFNCDFDFDAPAAIDFDLLVQILQDVRYGKKTNVPIYSFARHQREERTNSIYSPHVLILEGIFALHDQRILDMLDLRIFAEADADLCLSRRLLRDVRERGRDIEGCIKQWFSFVKPNFTKFVEPQREVADIIVPRGTDNIVAIDMVSDRIQKLLAEKSSAHRTHLAHLHDHATARAPRVSHSPNVLLLPPTPQVHSINTLLQDAATSREDFAFYTDRLAALLLERAVGIGVGYAARAVETPQGRRYAGLREASAVMATVLLRGGAVLEPALGRTLPSCRVGRVLIQSSPPPGNEPCLHYHALPVYEAATAAAATSVDDAPSSPSRKTSVTRVVAAVAHATQKTSKAQPSPPTSSVHLPFRHHHHNHHDRHVPNDDDNHDSDDKQEKDLPPLMLLLDAQMDSGAAALMAVRVLVDHGVPEDRVVFVALRAGEAGLRRLLSVFPDVRVVMAAVGEEGEGRWIERRYLGC